MHVYNLPLLLVTSTPDDVMSTLLANVQAAEDDAGAPDGPFQMQHVTHFPSACQTVQQGHHQGSCPAASNLETRTSCSIWIGSIDACTNRKQVHKIC